jgi:hypothetical protein
MEPELNGRETSYHLTPNYSYFLSDKLDIAVGLGYGRAKSTYNDNIIGQPVSSISKGFNGRIALRRYFLFENKIGIRTGPYFLYDLVNRDSKYTDGFVTKERIYSYSGGLSVDFVYYPTSHIGLAAMLGNISYNHQKNKGDTRSTANGFGVNLINNLSLSVFYTFGTDN